MYFNIRYRDAATFAEFGMSIVHKMYFLKVVVV